MFVLVARLPRPVLAADPLTVSLAQRADHARQRAGFSVKQMAAIMGLSESVLSRQLRPDVYPEAMLSLPRLARMPWAFWAYYLPDLAALLTSNMVRVYQTVERE
jgi:hypothetical protein